MVPVSPTSLPVTPPSGTAPGLAQSAPAATPDPDPAQAAVNSTVADMQLPPDVESFYMVGTGEAPAAKPHDVKPAMESNNLFEDLPKFLGQKGGPSNPAGLLAAQTEVIQVTLGWSLIGQMASKGASGIQSLFNNQV